MSVPETVTVALAALPESRAAANPDAPAIADDAVALDNATFADRVARAAALLERLGVGAGDAVALYGHEAVLEAAVVGRPDDVLGEVVVAYVALRPGAEAGVDELRDLCAERLAKYKQPVAIEVLETLPKNAVGKIDKPALRRLAGPAPSPAT